MSESELAYNLNLRADVQTDVNPKPRAKVHSVEWRKVMNGEWMGETWIEHPTQMASSKGSN